MASQSSVAWIFVSHSSKDLGKVRRVRNAIERAGGEPILFFLKCISDHDELDGLLKREIEARNFFLLCDSQNAKESKWVQDEVAHVRSLVGRKIEVINLDADWVTQREVIRRLVGGATVFLSYSQADAPLVRPVQRELSGRDFQVWMHEMSLPTGADWAEAIRAEIVRAIKEGYFLHFISRQSVRSPWVQAEAEMALRFARGTSYVPILLDSPQELLWQLPLPLRNQLMNFQHLDFSDRNVERLMGRLLPTLGLRNYDLGDARE